MTKRAHSALSLVLLAGCGGGASNAPQGCTDPLMIDDLEDGDRVTCAAGGLHGSWYVQGDGTSTNLSPHGDFTPTLIPGGREGSKYAARMTGFGFGGGAWMSVSLNGEGEDVAPYDASAIQGVRFWMKSNAPGLLLFDSAATSDGPGGSCTDTAETFNCGNPFAFGVTAPSTAWTEYQVPFSAGLQPFGDFDPSGRWVGGSAEFEPTQLLEIGFLAIGSSFDVWIDDLRGYTCAGAACVPTCSDPELPVACPATDGFSANCWPPGVVCASLRPIHLHEVWGSGPSDVWAVGWFVDRNINPRAAATVHWDGTAWSVVANDAPDQLRGVWGSGAADVWAVGGAGVVEHWDGARWSQVPIDTEAILTSVWGSGPSDVWIVGDGGTTLHFDGTSWSAISTGSTDVLMRVWGSGPSDVWAVGYPGVVGGGLGGIVHHWDGTAWSPVFIDGQAGPLYCVRGTGPNDVWAVGSAGTAIHWNGAAWGRTVTGSTQGLWSVWSGAPGEAWSVGELGGILHWNGVAWSAGEPGQSLFDVWGNGPADAWTVGNWGALLHWNGAAWSQVATTGLR